MASPADTSTPAAEGLERHYTVGEIAQHLHVHEDTVRKLFSEEPGVLKIGEPTRLLRGRGQKYKRRYFVLRIPQSVLVRVRERLMYKRTPNGVHLPDSGRNSGSRGLHAS
jgi:hypothetical protein